MARRRLFVGAAVILAAGTGALAVANDSAVPPDSTTPIKHVVVIFGENQSFDHYFATYPNATGADGTPFTGNIGGQTVDNLDTAGLNGNANPNSQKPRRLTHAEAVTCDFDHNYAAEQKAFNNGLMDKFPENTDHGLCAADPTIVMSYYDGNTVTALWNLAQNFSMSDRQFGTTFGPSTIGAINIVSGNTHGLEQVALAETGTGTMTRNSQPALDDCSTGKGAGLATFSGRNIGDLLNAKGVTWGWFAGGFRPTRWEANGDAVCAGTQTNAAGATVGDYFPHHEPFQFYRSTANPHHVPPSAVDKIGFDDGEVHHQYDLTDFDRALANGNLPQVSFLKAVSAEDGHPGYSGPLDEQKFIARVLNQLQRSPEWSTTAVILAYDDSDGWYDHAFAGIVNKSNAPSDEAGLCGGAPAFPTAYQGRCGYGPRLPLLIVSPWARTNFIDHSLTEQTSVTKFIEDNWALGRIEDQSFDARANPLDPMFNFGVGGGAAPKVFLNETTGAVLGAAPAAKAIAPARPDPGPRPTVTATPTATATATPKPTVVPTPTPKPPPAKVAVKLSCKVSGGGKRIKLACTGTGKDAATKTKLTIQIKKGSKVLASAKATLTKKKAKVTVKAAKTIKAGKYTLRITLAQTGRTTITTTKTIRLK